MLDRRWAGAPRAVRVTVAAEAGVLGYGTVVHVIQLATGGFPPYPWAPTWLAAYFASLTFLDPLAAALLLARRTAGLYLAAFVFVTDAAANGYAAYVLPDVTAIARASHAAITVMAIAVLAAAPFVRPWLRRRGGPPVRDPSSR
ncbi:MAG TPA: hypothetical protein VF462_09770 [Micromonosporaceae bacterium]